MKDLCMAVEEDNRKGRTREVFKKIKEITGKFTPRLDGVKGKDGKVLTEAMRE